MTKMMSFCSNSNQKTKTKNEILRLPFGAVRRCVNLLDLENARKKNLIWLQKLTSIQKRTSPLKCDYFRYPKPDFTASHLSTKVTPRQSERSSVCKLAQPASAETSVRS